MYSMNEQEVLLHVNHYQNPIPLCNCKTDIRMAHPCHACCASSIVSSQSYTDICLRRPCSLRYRNDLCRYSQNSSGGLTLRSLRDSGQSVQQLPCQGQKSGLRCTLKASLWSYGGGEVSSYMKLDEHWPAEIILCDTIRYDTIWYDIRPALQIEVSVSVFPQFCRDDYDSRCKVGENTCLKNYGLTCSAYIPSKATPNGLISLLQTLY